MGPKEKYFTEKLSKFGKPIKKSKNTGATAKIAPNARGKGVKRDLNTVKFWLKQALLVMVQNN
jgi:hypothetical protein